MDSLKAFAMGEANRNRELMVFDWDQAARLIRERKPSQASAGLAGDWEYTGGPIYADGKPIPAGETYTYLASTWAKPELDLDGSTSPCFRMASQTPGWDSGTYWPASALLILAGDDPAPHASDPDAQVRETEETEREAGDDHAND
jgi:hypothetical protein